MFRTSFKLRFSGEGVSGHDLRSDPAGIVIGGVTEVVEASLGQPVAGTKFN